ncbi:MAG: Hsp70 family protein [bacterium]|nr:Hsp70 family protein [bacterium]
MGNETVIGIDLGTSNSCVASIIDGNPVVLANEFDEHTTASVVAFKEDGSVNVGNQAKAQVILDPKNTVSSAKRLIGRYSFSEEVRKAKAICRYEIVEGENHSVRVRICGEERSIPEFSAHVLSEMKRVAEKRLGKAITGAVITVPAYFNDNQRQATKDAGRIANLEILRILNEPTAAALAYGYGKNLKQKVLVYDLGGGTFDVSVLEIEDDVYEVLSTCGDTYLGGDDFDDRLIDVLADEVKQNHGVNVRTDPMAFEKLKVAAESGKIALSEADSTQISIPELAQVAGETIGLEYTLTRREFEKLCQDLIHRTFKVCDEALQQASLTTRDLDGVIMVGGSTRLPIIRKSVSQYFQREPEVDVNPDEVVAVGAAIHAESLVSNSSETYLLDVTPLTLRLGIVGGVTEPIIERNSPVPIDHTRVFTTVQDHQEAIAVRIFQGEEREIEANTLLGEFEFSGFTPGPRGQVQIEVQFAIDTEGIVKVSARDPKTGVEASTTVSMSSGLSDEELQQIMERNSSMAAGVPEAIADDETLLPLPPPQSADEEEFLALPEVETSATHDAADGELFGAVGELSEAPPEEMQGTQQSVIDLSGSLPNEDLTEPEDVPMLGSDDVMELETSQPLNPGAEPIDLGGSLPAEDGFDASQISDDQVEEQLSELFEADDLMDAELLGDPEDG